MDTEQTKSITRSILKWLADLVKWLLIITTAAIAFYLVCPKYYFSDSGHIRCNKMTGKVERANMLNDRQRYWQSIAQDAWGEDDR